MRVKRKIRKHAKHFCVCVCPKHENMSGCSTKLGYKPGIFVVFLVVFSTCFLGTTPRVKHPIGNENPKWHESGFTRAKPRHYTQVPANRVSQATIVLKRSSVEQPSARTIRKHGQSSFDSVGSKTRLAVSSARASRVRPSDSSMLGSKGTHDTLSKSSAARWKMPAQHAARWVCRTRTGFAP